MESVATIGPSIHIKGDVTSREPLTIQGHVEGTISVDGHPLTLNEGGQLTATVMADTIVVSGRVTGSLSASGKVVVRAGASINGDISAPTVSLADGATLNGRIETSQRKAALSLAS
jgi:cytoskeletal protein CcmA (bactofilin family)